MSKLVAIALGALLSYFLTDALLKWQKQQQPFKNQEKKARRMDDDMNDLASHYFSSLPRNYALRRGHFELMVRAAQRSNIGQGVTMVVQVINSTIFVDRTGWKSRFAWENLRAQFVLEELRRLLDLPAGKKLRDFEFILNTADCPMWNFTLPAVTFSMLKCEGMFAVPLPQWNHWRDGNFDDWDDRMHEAFFINNETPWSQKSDKAVFMGGLRKGTYQRDKKTGKISQLLTRPFNWNTFSRGKMWHLAQQYPDLFDVSLTIDSSFSDREALFTAINLTSKPAMPMEEQARNYKYVVYIEGNCGWADRLKNLLAFGVVIFLQENICHEFFFPLLKPWIHYIPIRYDLTDLVTKVQWARKNDEPVREIGLNAAEFAGEVLAKNSWRKYVKYAFIRYSKLMTYKPSLRPAAMLFRKRTICKERSDNICNVDLSFQSIGS